MLKILRNKKIAKKIFIFLAIVIVPAFVLWGSASFLKEKSQSNYAGKIFGQVVSFDKYRKSFLACRNQAMLEFGENFAKLQQFLNLEKAAWNRLILLHEVEKQKIRISDKDVVKMIEDFGLFKSTGKFDPKRYQTIVELSLGVPMRLFEEETRESLEIMKLYEKVTADTSITDDQLLDAYKQINQKINVEYAFILSADFKNQAAASEEELKDFYQKNLSMFQKPFAMDMQYAGIVYPANATSADKTAIKKKLDEASRKLEKENDLEKVAKELSLTLKNTGLITTGETLHDMADFQELIQTAYYLNPNQISKPVELTNGCYIVKLNTIIKPYNPPFEKIKDSITDILLKNKEKELAKQKAQKSYENLKELLDNDPKAGFVAAANNLGLKTDSTGLFSRDTNIPKIGTSKEFSDAAFLLKQEQISPVIEMPQGFYILKFKEFAEIDEKKFATEKDQFKKNVLELKKQEAFQGFLTDLEKKANLEVFLKK